MTSAPAPLVGIVLMLLVGSGAAAEGGGGWYDALASEDSVVVGGGQDVSPPENSAVPVAGAGPVAAIFERIPRAFCGNGDATPTVGRACVDGADSGEVVITCADGSQALDPLFRRALDPVTQRAVGPWEQVDNGGCPEDVAPVITLSAEEFRRLPLAASLPSFQPAGGRGLVNMDLIAFTDAAPQELVTTVLGVPVTVRATPTQFAWDFGDGSAPVVTSDPGRPWPEHTVGHPYSRPGAYAVQLVTTWAGEYQVAGAGAWLPVDGTAQTTSPAFTATVEEARAHLVAGAQP